MERRLVCIHGRSQHGKDPKALRRMWAAGLNKGLTLADLPTIEPSSIVFLYYGDLIKAEIDALATKGLADERLTRMAVGSDGMLPGVGVAADPEVAQLQIELLGEVGHRAGRPLPPAQREATRGILDDLQRWQALQDALDWVSDSAPWMGEKLLYLVTRDVALYLTKKRIRNAVQKSLAKQLDEEIGADESIVLLTHSLGTVVGMDLITSMAPGSRVPLMVTCGSPLGIKSIYSKLKRQPQPAHPKRIDQWFNAYDPRDVVALEERLLPLFGGGLVDIKVQNGDQPHDIDRYLAHDEVAHHIGIALAKT
jgi:endonuclease G, mitochondrial